MDNTVLNPNEGKVETFVWPFYRYNVLLPKQTKVDLFVWLFLSVYIQQCHVHSKDKKIYDITLELDTRKIIQNRFPEVIDNQIMDLIVSKVKIDFTYLDHESKKITFKDEMFGFVKTYQELFSKELQIKYMYQCAFTGDVVPFFGDDVIDNDENRVPFSLTDQKTPNTHTIKEIYKKFIKLDKVNRNDIAINRPSENIDLIDEDSESFFDDDFEEDLEDEFKNEIKNKTDIYNFSIQIIDGYKTQVNYLVKVFVEDNELKVISPFPNYTNNWLNRKFVQAQNLNDNFKDFIRIISEKWIIPEEIIDHKIKLASNNWENSLKHTASLMKLVLGLGKRRLIKSIYMIDQYFDHNDYDPYWMNIGKFLEGLFRELPINNNKDKSFSYYMMLLKTYGNENNVDVSPLTKQKVYENWKHDRNNFKSKIIDAIFEHEWFKSDSVYTNVITDIFELYSYRNSRSHFNLEDVVKPSIQQIETLYKITSATKNLI